MPSDDMNLVYRLDANTLGGAGNSVELPHDYRLVAWEPSLLRPIPDNIAFEKIGFLKNWVFHAPRFLSGRNQYSVYSLMTGPNVITQCILTPGSSRYRFMAPDDMQFGLVYTSPDYRQKKFASLMIKAILGRAGKSNTYWWITEPDNFASRKVAEGAGFKLVSKAVRKSVMGFSYYTLESS